MASSYHIYIHADGVGNGTSPTKPKKSSKPTQSKQSKEESSGNLAGTLRQVGGFLENPDSMVGAVKGAAIAKTGAIGAVVMVAYNIGMKVANEVIDLQSMITGDISNQVALNNFTTFINKMFTPLSTTISYAKYNIQLEQNNQRARLQSQLLGDSVVNQNYNRKV